MLSGGVGKLSGMAGLTNSFDILGMCSDMVGQFIPIVLDYVKGRGGEKAMKLLQGSLQ